MRAGTLASDQPLRVLHQRSMRQRRSLGLKTGLSLRRCFDVSLIWLVKGESCTLKCCVTLSRDVCAWVCVGACHPRVIKTDVNTERGLEKWTKRSWHYLCTLQNRGEPGESELECIDRGGVSDEEVRASASNSSTDCYDGPCVSIQPTTL